MKFLWWYSIVWLYIGAISNSYMCLVERVEPGVHFFAVTFAIPTLIFLHKVKKVLQ